MPPEPRITFCRICEASCGLVAHVEDGRVTKLAPDERHVVSRGFACIKGIRYTELHNSEDRVTQPLKRVGTEFVPVSWEQALTEIGDKTRALRARLGDDCTGMYIGNPATLSPAHLTFAGLFRGGLGTRHLYTSGSQDCNNKFVAAEEMFGSPLLQAIPDIDHAEHAIVLGSNPAISQLSLVNMPRAMERLKSIVRERHGQVVFINPRRIESAHACGDYLPIRAGTDVFFLLAFAHVMFADGLIEPSVVAHCDGVEALSQRVRPWDPERVQALTGIDAQRLRDLAHGFCKARAAVLIAGTGVNQGPHGTLCAWLVNAIAVLSGHLDRRGGMLMTRQQIRTAKMGYPHGSAIPHHTSRLSNHRSVLDSLPAALLADEILTPGPGQLQALFVTAGNPLLSCPNSAHLAEALRALPLLVSIDLFRNETGNLAHYILPATSFLERGDFPAGTSGYQPIPYLQTVEPVVPPRGDARDEWWIFTRLAHSCGIRLGQSRLAQVWLERSTREPGRGLPRWLCFAPILLAAVFAWLERVSLRKLRRQVHGRLLRPHRAGIFLGRNVLTDNGRVHLAPASFESAANKLDAAFQEQLRSRSGLLLISKREKRSHNSWMHNAPSLGGRGRASGNQLVVHPNDAHARGLKDGDVARLQHGSQSLRVPIRISEEISEGAVALPHGWGHEAASGLRVAQACPGSNANLLSPDGAHSLEDLAGMSFLTALPVELSKDSESAALRERDKKTDHAVPPAAAL